MEYSEKSFDFTVQRLGLPFDAWLALFINHLLNKRADAKALQAPKTPQR